jgi:hypothetical protein
MDGDQLYRLYQQETRFHDNPPSFTTWVRAREERKREAAEVLADPELMKLLKGGKS